MARPFQSTGLPRPRHDRITPASGHHGKITFMRVLLTGGYGCLGSWIVRNLLGRGDHVWVYDVRKDLRRLRLLIPDDRLAGVPFIQGTVTDRDALRRVLDVNGITHVIHLAGLQVPTCRADPMYGA